MKIVLHKKSNIPIYQQIYIQIIQRIQSGMLAEGASLPSLRSMADDLKVSVLTVRKAYKRLEMKGFVHIQPGKGVYIKGKRHTTPQIHEPYDWQHTKAVNVVRSQYVIN